MNPLKLWFPTSFHLHTSWQPISINCTLHISKMFVINVAAVISNYFHNFWLVSCLTLSTYVPFSAIIQFFSRTPICPSLYPWGYTYPRLGITALKCHLISARLHGVTFQKTDLIYRWQENLKCHISSVVLEKEDVDRQRWTEADRQNLCIVK
jgi:hypothetical protein